MLYEVKELFLLCFLDLVFQFIDSTFVGIWIETLCGFIALMFPVKV
jgi:hypothetical protein